MSKFKIGVAVIVLATALTAVAFAAPRVLGRSCAAMSASLLDMGSAGIDQRSAVDEGVRDVAGGGRL